MLAGAPIAYSPVKLAEAEVAMRDQRAHPELRAQSHRRRVVGFGRGNIRAVAMCDHIAEKAMSPSLMTAFAALASEQYSARAKVPCLVEPTSKQVCLAELHHARR